MKIIHVIISTVLTLILFGCASKHYEEAQVKDTVYAYNQFLKEYGDSEYARSARKNRNALIALNKAKKKNTIEGYDEFLSKYSISRYTYQAKNKKDLLLQKSDYNEAIQNEENNANYYLKLMPKSTNSSSSNTGSSGIFGLFSALVSSINHHITYEEYLDKWEYKVNSILNNEIKNKQRKKISRIKNKYINDLKSKLKNAKSAISQAHIMVEYAYNSDYYNVMKYDNFLKKFGILHK